MPTDIRSPAEIGPLISRVTKSADKAVEGMRVLVREQPNSLAVLHAMRFDRIGWHPLEDRVLNLVEQINQTWTCLVTLYALKFLFDRHRSAASASTMAVAGRVEERRQAMIAKGWSPATLAALEEAMEPKFLREQKQKEELRAALRERGIDPDILEAPPDPKTS